MEGQLWDAGPVAHKRKMGRPITTNNTAHRDYMRDYMRERAAGLPGRRARRKKQQAWRPEEDRLLGKGSDRVVAIVLRRTAKSVYQHREQLGIPRHTKRRRNPKGYDSVVLPRDHPFIGMARHDRSVPLHRLVMAEHLGRPLARDEFVHHRNGRRDDNRIDNLELWTRSHPDGQRVEDVLDWAVSFIERYAHEAVFSEGNDQAPPQSENLSPSRKASSCGL